MNLPTRASNLALAALCVALAVLAAPAAALAAEPTVQYRDESFQAFERQLDGGQIAAVTFNKRIRSLRITLKNGEHALAKYPPHESGATIAKVQAKHVPVSILSVAQAKEAVKKQTVHHKIRYIAGAVVIVAIVVVGLVLLARRRRERE